jgi:hypothetical protein
MAVPPGMSLGPASTAAQVEAVTSLGHPDAMWQERWQELKQKAAPDDRFYWYTRSSVGGGSNGYALISKGCFVGAILVMSRKYHITHNGT